MSSGFVTGGISNANDDGKHSPPRTQDSWERAEEAIKLAQWQQEEQSRGRDGEKSLYEILQANKARKQEEFEEKLKFKNQFKPLDEDDVEYLDSILSEQARAEQLRKQELALQLDEFRKRQYEAENAGNAETLENIPKVEDIVIGGWNTAGRKRKKAAANENTESGAGLKLRKTSGAVPPKKPEAQKSEKQPKDAKDAKATETKPGGDKGGKIVKTSAGTAITQSDIPHTSPKTDAAKSPAIGSLMGLVTYSSDEDD